MRAVILSLNKQFPMVRTFQLDTRQYIASNRNQKGQGHQATEFQDTSNIQQTGDHYRHWMRNGLPEITLGLTILILLGVDQSFQYYHKWQRDQVLRLLQSSEKENMSKEVTEPNPN